MEKMFKACQCNHVRVASALEAQNNETDILVFRAAFKFFKAAIELWCSAKKKLSLQIIKQHRGARGVVLQTFSHHALIADHQLGPTEQGGTRNKQQERKGHANEDREFNADEHSGECGDENQTRIVTGRSNGVAQTLPIDQSRRGDEEQTGESGLGNETSVGREDNNYQSHGR